jgi:hypothetical protein
VHFTRWHETDRREGVRGELWNSHRAVAHYFLTSAVVLSTPRFDRFTGEPIGPIITEHHAKQIILQDRPVADFLAELPPVPTEKVEKLWQIVNESRTVASHYNEDVSLTSVE